MIALDTNILVYAVEQGEKPAIARSIVARAMAAGCIIPAQVLAEFANVCRRKSIASSGEVLEVLSALTDTFSIIPTGSDAVSRAIMLADRRRIAFFDALIAHVAREAGATTLLSEDMHDGADLDGITVLNPFFPTNAERVRMLLGG